MSERYTKHIQVGHEAYLCSHCGCWVGDRELHDRVNGLDLVDTANEASRTKTPLAPPEPPA